MKCLVITPYFPPAIGGACRMLGPHLLGPHRLTGTAYSSAALTYLATGVRRTVLISVARLITVARLQERKGHDVVVQALAMIAALVPDVHYLIVGKGDQKRILDLAEQLEVRHRVTIVESLSDELLVDPTSAEETARVTVQLLTDDGRRNEMGAAARRRTVEQFDDAVFLKRIREVCRQFAETR